MLSLTTVTLIFQDIIYLVDSHQRDSSGMVSSEGGAVPLRFSTTAALSAHIRLLYSSPNTQFDCIPVYTLVASLSTDSVFGR